MERSANALSEFLRERRARLRPEELGFGRGPRRRVAGLRREEVAELMGVSDVWYSRCETGKARLSLAALDRLAHVLQLDAQERKHLFALARPELGTLSAAGSRDALHGTSRDFAEFHRFAKRLTTCSTTVEIAAAATRAIYGLIEGPGLAYWESVDASETNATFEAVEGHKADAIFGHVQPLDTIPHLRGRLWNGFLVSEADLTKSPSAELRSRVDLVGTHSFFGVAARRADGTCASIFGYAKIVRSEPTPLEVQTVETIGAMVELALHSAREPRRDVVGFATHVT